MPRKLYIDEDGLGEYANLVQKYMNDKYNTGTTTDNEKAKIYTELKLAVENEKIKSIIVNKEGYITIKTNELIITEPILKRKFYVGSYEIKCHFYGTFKFKSTSEFRNELAFRSGCWRGKTVHPHINSFDGHACLGNAETPMLLFIQQGEIRALISIIIGYLETVNINDSAGKYIGCLPELELDESGKPILLDENAEYITGKYIIRTDNEFAGEEEEQYKAIRGITKSKAYAISGSKYCECCGQLFNSWEIDNHISDYGWVCDDCYKNLKVCDVCGRLIKKEDDYAEYNGATYCYECKNNYLVECSQCGETITSVTKEQLDALPSNQDKISLLNDSIKSYSHYVIDNELNDKNIYVCDNCKPTIPNNPVLSKLLINDKIETTYEVNKINVIDSNKRCDCKRCGSYFSIGKMFRRNGDAYCNTCAYGMVNIRREDDNVVLIFDDKVYKTREEKVQFLDNRNNKKQLPLYIINKENIKEEYLNGSRV